MNNNPAYEELTQQVKDLSAEIEMLRSSEKFFENLVYNSLDVIFTIDLKGNYAFRNEVAEKMIGYSVDELMTMNIRDMVTPAIFF